MPRRSLSGFLTRAPFLDTQTKNGFRDEYSAQFTTNQAVQDRTGAGAQLMQFSYTPPVDAWWEVWGNIGLVFKVDANYHAAYGTLLLTPVDVDGINNAYTFISQHLQVQTYEPRAMHRIFKLAANTSYTVALQIVGLSGGTWQYYCGPGQLWLNARAWPR